MGNSESPAGTASQGQSARSRGPDFLAVDLENVFGCPWSTLSSRQLCRRTAELVAVMSDETTAMFAANSMLLGRVLAVVTRAGVAARAPHRFEPDGADKILQHALESRTWRRHDHVVLASGDGGFLPVLERLQSAGAVVTVAAVRGACSRRLAQAADDVLWLSACTSPVAA